MGRRKKFPQPLPRKKKIIVASGQSTLPASSYRPPELLAPPGSGTITTTRDYWDTYGTGGGALGKGFSYEKNLPSIPFKPKVCTPEIVYSGVIPTIYVTPEAYSDMLTIVDESPEEVSWLGAVDMLDSDFLIHEIFLIDQECGPASTDMLEEGFVKLSRELLARPNGTELWNSIKFWGHSHVRMDVFASGTDDAQMDRFKRNARHDEWFIRGIFNKKGNAKFWLYHSSSGIVINDVQWMIYHEVTEGRRDKWKAEIEDKVSTRIYVPPATAYVPPANKVGGYGYNSGRPYTPYINGEGSSAGATNSGSSAVGITDIEEEDSGGGLTGSNVEWSDSQATVEEEKRDGCGHSQALLNLQRGSAS
jgi:hypothetical protein